MADGRACECPICQGTARQSQSKTGWATLVCSDCKTQIFARKGGRSDALLRALPDVATPAAPAPAPVAPATTAAAPAPAPAPAPARRGWGVLG